MKRFTETTKWDDPWFRKLPPEAKLFWDWICSKCDQAGVIEPDFDLAAFQTGAKITSAILKHFDGRISKLQSGKLHITKFVQFQYGKLSRLCKPHAPVFAAMEKHGINPDDVHQNERFKESVDPSLRSKIIERDGRVCIYSGDDLTDERIVIDHVIPISAGGRAVAENLVVSSREMNSMKWDYCLATFCKIANLDLDAVIERVSRATGKAIEPYLGRVKEKEEEKEEETEKDTEPEKEPKQSPSEEFQETWNQSTFPKIATMSAGRTKSLNARFQETFFQANWKEGIAKASRSDFCNGKNDRGWKADPDWFLRPDTLPKILEGKYDNKTATQTVMIIE